MMALPYLEIKNRAHEFIINYKDAVKENAESQSFLNDFFNIFGISRRRIASFEQPVKTDKQGSTKRIDLFWRGKLLVEMKSTGQNLDKAYQQGVGYFEGLKDSELPRYVMVCDLNEFRLYDLDDGKNYAFLLKELPEHLHLFDFMQGNEIEDITEYDLNEKAAELLGKLHDALEQSGYIGHQLQVFMVRILFILFAEDTGVFNRHQFTRYLMRFTSETGFDTDMHLHKLFQTLDKPLDERNVNLSEELNAFPYVNGHLFRERIELPSFTTGMREQLIQCCLFNWKEISPAIFGSLFQSIMNKKARRNLGAHYTSEANIIKLIEPLFLTQLHEEFNKINTLKQTKLRNSRLIELMNKVRGLSFLDPACGCGNFLIITYRELRQLELKIMQAQEDHSQGHVALTIDPQISLNNFYGIEIDEWPARIAEVAMWLTQHQMNLEFAKSFGREPDLLPLKEHANIHHANALTTDWAKVVNPQQLNFIIGNPPFIGKKEQSKLQKQNFNFVTKRLRKNKVLDFVCAWYVKSILYSEQNAMIECAFVSTNSITQGEQVPVLWGWVFEQEVSINFAHRTFLWRNAARGKAAVHCVIIGFSRIKHNSKQLFEYDHVKGLPKEKLVSNINPYLIDQPNKMVVSRRVPVCDVPSMIKGNEATDNGHLILSEQEKIALITGDSSTLKWVRPFMSGGDFINGATRWCLWLKELPIRDIKKNPLVMERINAVRTFREASTKAATVTKAQTPSLFGEIRQAGVGLSIIVPKVSSERRDYVPMGFVDSNVILNNTIQFIPNGSLYIFGVIQSAMHIAWLGAIGGRMKSDYQYSISLVYNNFPWPESNDQQCQHIESLAKAVLDARQEEIDQDASTTLADLYDPDLMPPTLRKAHKKLDKAVDALYQPTPFKSSLERVKHLFICYEKQLQVMD